MKFCSHKDQKNVVMLIIIVVGTERNPFGPDVQPLQCYICKSIMYLVNNCPNKSDAQKDFDDIHVQFFANGVKQCYLNQVVPESLNSALLYSGWSSTVCRKNWLNCYINSLPEGSQLVESESSKSFKFGPGSSFPSLNQVNIQVTIGGMSAYILTDIVNCKNTITVTKDKFTNSW